MDISKLKSYVECVVTHQDGSKRIGRLTNKREFFELASFQERKVNVVWPIEKCIDFKVIDWA